MNNKVDLTKEQTEALNILMNNDENVFLTGHAGTGKSYLLKKYFERTKQNIVKLGSTGVAANHIGGETVHSYFGIKPETFNRDVILDMNYRPLRKLLKAVDVIVIDEISMVSSHLFTMVDKVLRIVMKNEKVFGGKRLIVVGDFCQIRPVIVSQYAFYELKDNYGGIYAFNAQCWEEANFTNIILKTIIRQQDAVLTTLLNNLRMGKLSDENFTLLDKRYKRLSCSDFKEDVTFLCGTNQIRFKINNLFFEKLKTASKSYAIYFHPNGEYGEYSCKGSLKLKVGLRVMLTCNLRHKKKLTLTNGHMGIVKELGEHSVFVDFDNYKENPVEITYTKTENNSYQHAETKGKFRKVTMSYMRFIPLEVAHAITIHKSQGQTLEKIHIVNDFFFEAYQFYVALSRAKSLDGVTLQYLPKPKHVMIYKPVQEFYDNLD